MRERGLSSQVPFTSRSTGKYFCVFGIALNVKVPRRKTHYYQAFLEENLRIMFCRWHTVENSRSLRALVVADLARYLEVAHDVTKMVANSENSRKANRNLSLTASSSSSPKFSSV